MKIFSIVGFALAANGLLANGLAIKGGSNAPRVFVQSQQQEALPSLNLGDSQQEESYAPTPYQFSFDTNSDGSSSSRSESGDGSGKVFGQYAIKGADGRERIVSYTADSEGFRANVSTNELGTESQNPSFVVFKSSQLPAPEISRQLQTELDLAQQEEQPAEEQAAEIPAPVSAPKSVGAPPRKSSPAKSNVARRPQQSAMPQQKQAQVSMPAKSKRPVQQAIAQSKRPVSASPSKGAVPAVRRAPAKTILISTTTQRPRSAPSKRPVQPQLQEAQEEAEAPAQLNLSSDQTEEAVSANEEESQDF